MKTSIGTFVFILTCWLSPLSHAGPAEASALKLTDEIGKLAVSAEDHGKVAMVVVAATEDKDNDRLNSNYKKWLQEVYSSAEFETYEAKHLETKVIRFPSAEMPRDPDGDDGLLTVERFPTFFLAKKGKGLFGYTYHKLTTSELKDYLNPKSFIAILEKFRESD